MELYPKIQTVYLRDPATKHRTLLDGQFAKDSFAYLASSEWEWSEKVDGTNIRVHWDGEKARFGGRTDNAQIPTFLYDRLRDLFDDNAALREIGTTVTLYGEGYGAKIQKGGGNYKPDGVDFVLFDVKVGPWWLKRDDVRSIAVTLGVDTVAVVGTGGLVDAVALTAQGFQSRIGTASAEGLVMRPMVPLLERDGSLVITKIKHRDFA